MGDHSSYDADGSDGDRTETGSQEERGWERRFHTGREVEAMGKEIPCGKTIRNL